MTADPVAALREAALAAERAGKADKAKHLFDRAIAHAPADAGIYNSAAGSALRLGDMVRAEHLYRQAQRLAPADPEIAINLAIALSRRGRSAEATSVLVATETAAASLPRYWSTRANAERDEGNLSAAEISYARCLALSSDNARALHGAAWVALERGKPATAKFDLAVRANPADREAWFGRAQALEAEGDRAGAIRALRALVAQAPDFGRALLQLAQWRSVDGDPDSCDHFVAASESLPADPEIHLKWCEALASASRYAEAADRARRARLRFPHDARFVLAEATYAGEAGEDQAAEHALAGANLTPAVCLEKARQLLRRGNAAEASAILSQVIERDSANVLAWALQGIAWRVLGDPRSDWLHGQQGLVSESVLDLHPTKLHAVRDLLDRLHANAARPLGQSVRAGTQTRGSLLARAEPEVADLAIALQAGLERYRARLPQRDERHPLLRYRDDCWAIVGSWSVRLGHSGHHISHIHPNGAISSAAYFQLPPRNPEDPLAGALELGRPPSGLRLDLDPLHVIVPREGTLVLFPSTLYHGTRPFGAGVRMTAAIDVAPRPTR